MYGTVTKFYDIHGIAVPSEYSDISVSEEEIKKHHAYLAAAYGEQIYAETVNVGDCAECKCESGHLAGRKVLLFPGKMFPQAEQAEAAVVGKNVGEAFFAALSGAECVLRIEKILRTVPATVDDKLISRMETDAKTLEEYDNLYKAKEIAGKRERNGKKLGIYLLNELVSRCEFSFDEPAIEEHVQKELSALREQGKDASEDSVRNSFTEQLKQNLVLTELCRRRGVAVAEEDVALNVDMMLEMYTLMGETAPDRADLIEQYIQAEYYTKGMDILLREIYENTEATE